MATDLQPGSKDLVSQARDPAQGVQDVAVAHGDGACCQCVHIGHRRGQAGQQAPHQQEVVMHGRGILGEKTRASINGERIRVQHGIPLSHNGMGALHIIVFIIINRTEPLSYYFAV